jgi:hypothetical protein
MVDAVHPAEGRRRQVPAANGPVARRRRRAKTQKRKITARPSIQHTISAGAIRAPVESVSPPPRINTASASRKIGRDRLTLYPSPKLFEPIAVALNPLPRAGRRRHHHRHAPRARE